MEIDCDGYAIIKTINGGQLRHYQVMVPIVNGIRRSGIESTAQIAKLLNKQGFRTCKGRLWTHKSVERVIAVSVGVRLASSTRKTSKPRQQGQAEPEAG